MGHILPSVPWSCKGCPVVSWRSWLGDKVNLFPWNCRVTGVSGWDIRFWLPATLAGCAIFTTSPPSMERRKGHIKSSIEQTAEITVTKQYILQQLVKGWKRRQDMQNQGGLISGTSIVALHDRTIAAPTCTNPEGERKQLWGQSSGETESLKYTHTLTGHFIVFTCTI